MNANPCASRRFIAVGLLAALFAPLAHAGVFLNETPGKVTHSGNYAGSGGERVMNVCLDPAAPPLSGSATQATANAVAEYNRLQGQLGNVVSAASVGASGVDYESILMHELGHCVGLDHNVLGPSEVGCSLGGTCVNSPTLFYTNSSTGANTVYDTAAGTDGARGTGDDSRGDDVARHWHRIGNNNPFVEPPVADRTTFVQSGGLPAGDTFSEAVTSFSPCTQGTVISNTSLANGQLPTSDVMMPVLCTNNVVRDLSPNDRSMFRVARAGFDGVAGNADDYTLRLNFQGTDQTNCDIRIQFPNGGGFFCQVSLFIYGNGDQSVGDNNPNAPSGSIQLDRNTNWFFNQNDTTGAPPLPCLFRDGFEDTPVNCAG